MVSMLVFSNISSAHAQVSQPDETQKELDRLRASVIETFNQNTSDNSLHFNCSTTPVENEINSCAGLIIRSIVIPHSKEQSAIVKNKDKLVFEQLRYLRATNPKFRQVFDSYKLAEKKYLSQHAND